VEFALVAAFGGFLLVLIGIFELGRVMYTFNTASEATRLGARTAIVCDAGDERIKLAMMALLPSLSADQIDISYRPSGCAASATAARGACTSVTVSLNSSAQLSTVIPFVPLSINIPPFTTTMTREAMDSSKCDGGNLP
jgi:Flp pilus assembly protein TadG